MDQTPQGYRPLLGSIESDEEKEQYSNHHLLVPRVYGFAILFTAFVLVVSLSFNFLLAAKLLDLANSPKNYVNTDGRSRTESQVVDGRTRYAGLTRDIAVPWTWHGPFFQHNETRIFEKWLEVDSSDGIVALTDTYVQEKGLPASQRFPWDAAKGVYLVNAFHNLHCLKVLATTLMNYRLKQPQTEDFEHALHCLDALRQDVVCDADDTPRWTGFAEMVSGPGQFRQCKEWGRLQAWARQNNACHRHIKLKEGEEAIEMYKYCPEGSPYTEQVKEYFGDPGSE